MSLLDTSCLDLQDAGAISDPEVAVLVPSLAALAAGVDPLDIDGPNPFRADFPLLANEPGLVYLDSAATAQRPALVLEAQGRFYRTMNANPLRGLYRHSQEATAAIEGVREHLARFFGTNDGNGRSLVSGAPAASEFVFTRNASESLNLAAHGLTDVADLGPGDEVCITIMEHHSNLIPWQRACARTGASLVYLRPDEQGVIGDEEIAAKIGPRTKIVSVTHVSNVLGVVNPIRRIADAAHAVGATMVVDGAQSAQHLRIDLPELGCDLFAFSAHKMFGPMGIGVLWGRADILDKMPPMLTGGEMIDSVTECDAVWAPVPAKFEAGTQDAAGIWALGAAMDYLEAVGRDVAEQREALLTERLARRLGELPFVDTLGPDDPALRVGAVSFDVHGIHPHDVASLLDEADVDIRAGHHCAQPLLAWLGVPSSCRASVALYNDAHDIDRMVEALEGVWRTFNGNA